jgi:hypothetical protein
VKAAADYFSKLELKQWIKVVESDTVPKTRFAGGMLVPAEPRRTEPIGQRIIEIPEDLTRTELRDSRSGFVAYVPPGSIKKGEWLVRTGGSRKTIQCEVCHGAERQHPVGRKCECEPRRKGRARCHVARRTPLLPAMRQAATNATTAPAMNGLLFHGVGP